MFPFLTGKFEANRGDGIGLEEILFPFLTGKFEAWQKHCLRRPVTRFHSLQENLKPQRYKNRWSQMEVSIPYRKIWSADTQQATKTNNKFPFLTGKFEAYRIVIDSVRSIGVSIPYRKIWSLGCDLAFVSGDVFPFLTGKFEAWPIYWLREHKREFPFLTGKFEAVSRSFFSWYSGCFHSLQENLKRA